MPESRNRTAGAETDALFDRYTLPRVALTVILAVSLVGTWVTTRLEGGGPGLTVAKWEYFVALGVLTGGLVWKHLFVRPADLGTDAADYCAEMYERFDRIALGALAVLTASGVVVLGDYVAAFGPTPPAYGFGALLASFVAVGTATTVRSGPVEAQFRSPSGIGALALALALVAATAVAEVATRGFDPVAAVVRTLHLLAFAVWLGGAVWNIFVAVPTGQKRPTVAVVRAAGEQLERFRWAVRFVFPAIFLTGLYQAVDGLGTAPGTYLDSAVGLAVLAKVGFVGLLIVIFELCPMWRACSPIEGVCELDDLGGPGTDGGPATDDGPVGDGEVTGDD
ncbi:hypothetical protein [Halomicrobium urmianum]|uniref:hypothetical protein n=1 Tax=Halomicrobium urmianum TaxID=1586233 RepID=UPI001CDA0AB0|nr:hypothetical protein [Halomicrobium urmianum]